MTYSKFAGWVQPEHVEGAAEWQGLDPEFEVTQEHVDDWMDAGQPGPESLADKVIGAICAAVFVVGMAAVMVQVVTGVWS